MSIDPRRTWLILPAWIAFSIDVGLTLHGQSDAFWAGHYEDAIEFNPIAKPILAEGPWLFVGAALTWQIFLSLVVVVWRHRFTSMLAIVITFSHAIGGSSWLIRAGAWGWVAALAYLFTLSELSRVSWKRAGLSK